MTLLPLRCLPANQELRSGVGSIPAWADYLFGFFPRFSSTIRRMSGSNMDGAELIPERRAKSWKREHEERCRRHQNNDPKKSRDIVCESEQSLISETKEDFTKEGITEDDEIDQFPGKEAGVELGGSLRNPSESLLNRFVSKEIKEDNLGCDLEIICENKGNQVCKEENDLNLFEESRVSNNEVCSVCLTDKSDLKLCVCDCVEEELGESHYDIDKTSIISEETESNPHNIQSVTSNFALDSKPEGTLENVVESSNMQRISAEPDVSEVCEIRESVPTGFEISNTNPKLDSLVLEPEFQIILNSDQLEKFENLEDDKNVLENSNNLRLFLKYTAESGDSMCNNLNMTAKKYELLNENTNAVHECEASNVEEIVTNSDSDTLGGKITTSQEISSKSEVNCDVEHYSYKTENCNISESEVDEKMKSSDLISKDGLNDSISDADIFLGSPEAVGENIDSDLCTIITQADSVLLSECVTGIGEMRKESFSELLETPVSSEVIKKTPRRSCLTRVNDNKLVPEKSKNKDKSLGSNSENSEKGSEEESKCIKDEPNGNLYKTAHLNDTSSPVVESENIVQSETEPLDPKMASEDKRTLELYVSEVEQRLTQKQILRQENQDVASLRPDESYFSKLDSSLKKNTAFVRKLKTFTCSQLDSLLKDMASLNLTKYVSEAASAIVEAKLKMTDVTAAVELCNTLHHMYAEFSMHLLENWHRFLSIKKDDRSINQSKLRVDLRFYAELINVGIFTHKEGLPLLGNVLTVLVNMDREEHNNVNIILSFCRHCGEDYAGLVPRKIRMLAENFQVALPRSKLLTKEKQRNVKTLLKDYYASLVKHVMKEHRDLQAFERQNKKILQTRGELSGERKEKWETLKYSYERLQTGMTTFAEILDEDVPELPEDEYLKDEDLRMIGTSDGEDSGFTSTIWEDEEEQRFYEYLTDMKEFLPSITVRPPEPVSEISEEVLDEEAEELDEESVAEGKDDEEEPSPPEPDDIEELESVTNSSNKILMESFLTHLPHCVNREMIDSSAVEFVMNLNTKYNRKKLVKMLFSVPRTRLDLLPFYARFVATLHPVVPDVSMELGQFLKQDFKFHVRKKDQINIESKIKVVRFIGELVKFRMYSKIEALYCLKLLLHDFTHHHIEMCCSLLESCGRYLFRNPDSHQRTKVYLEQMMRKKSVTALDSRYVTMIENAFYYVDPPDTAPFVKKERPPMHEFIRKILYQELMKANTDKVLRLMRKLDWENSDLAEYAVKCLTMAHNVKYYNIRCLASLLAGLVTHQEMVGTHVVDGVMEDIRLGMEVNLPKYSQRRVAMIKYLGELYNYRMVESSDIFKVLYSLISFGVSLNTSSSSFLDPPEHLFRIRLVCVLLETCGQYFNNGISKLKLDYFFTYFQRYFWFKYEDKCWTPENPFPVGIHYLFKDTLTSLRPKLQLFSSFEEANQAVRQMQLDLAPMLSDHMPWLYSNAGNDTESTPAATPGSDLGTIVEAASEGDDDICTESEPADATDAETETEESLSHDGRPMKKPVKCAEGEEGDGGEEEEDEFCEALSEFEDGEGGEEAEAEQDWGATGTSPHQSQGDEASLAAALPQGPTHVECPEDEDFLSAFDRMVSDNIQDRMRETVKPQQLDISVPLHIKSSAKKTYEQLQETRIEEKSTMNFVLMVRKGHKQQYKSLAVPINSELALNLKNREEAERAEKEKVKRLTLDINERLEEEDYQEMLAQAQRPVVMNLNRERKHKYQHPKGAPDADLIFGPKKVR
ncbi:regulator of nonsense transcripts 2-like isoform X2 [Periplaneta americana]|uniref:regulator of nonsense transcripts 2-like isoform X2 n=1 Tax=Periplaneta americana TaxID=6978 RepID=UPI0037E71FD1